MTSTDKDLAGAAADNRNTPGQTGGAWGVYVTAIIEGASVMVVEIAGARALAPFFGTSLAVWTSIITATLLFLALGYGLGGLLAKRRTAWTLPAVFGIAGIWLGMYPVIRLPVLERMASVLGVVMGSLGSAAVLFGLPLMMLGASSPVMIGVLDRRRPGAGSAAGRLFFVNTMGGLCGGWMTAFVLIPYSSLRLALAGTGVVLLVVSCAWAMGAKRWQGTVVGVLMIGGVYGMGAFDRPSRLFKNKSGRPFTVLYSQQSGVGLVQVLDFVDERWLQIDGVIQGVMKKATGLSSGYAHDERILAYCYHPGARRALQLGLGPGLLCKELALNGGMDVTAAELDPRVAEAARKYFDLPGKVKVAVQDGRDFLRRSSEQFDLIFLDTYAGDTTPWHLMTLECMEDVKDRLRPGGRLIVNFPAYANKPTPQLQKVESAAMKVFGDAIVVFEEGNPADPESVVNAHVVAGENLSPTMSALPAGVKTEELAKLVKGARRASGEATPMTDDRSDLDYLESSFCVRWRRLIWDDMPAGVLGD
jgi:spermidine synthase